MTLLVIWLICGALTAVVASAKGLNVPLWAVGGFLFGILGLIAVAAMPSEVKKD